jgi:mono/diheme cytochrome c family protein
MKTSVAAILLIAPLALAACGGNGGSDAATAPAEAETAVGDAARGERIFDEQGCGNCHAFEAAGTTRNVGPNLDQVVARYDAAFVRESLVDPQAYIEKGMAGSIGGDQEYGTLMPSYGPDSENATNRLTEQQLADLIAYVMRGKS